MCEKALPFRCSSIRNSARLSLAVRARAPALPASSMTGRAACQNCGLLNVILLFQVHSFGDLVFSGSPFHVENLIFRAHKIFGMTMTLKTPFHLQRISL